MLQWCAPILSSVVSFLNLLATAPEFLQNVILSVFILLAFCRYYPHAH
jgi:hypothetical protein